MPFGTRSLWCCLYIRMAAGTGHTTYHTPFVKLTLCNGCYLIIENGRGRNQVSLCWGGKPAQRLQQSVCSAPTGWGSCCRIMICPLDFKLVGSTAKLPGGSYSYIWGRINRRVGMSSDSHHDRTKKKSATYRISANERIKMSQCWTQHLIDWWSLGYFC